MTPAAMLAHLNACNGIAWEDLDADTARALHALLSDSAPSSTVAEHSGADTAAGEGVPSEERRPYCAIVDRGHSDPLYGVTLSWACTNAPGDSGDPLPTARNCPGWAPKSEAPRG